MIKPDGLKASGSFAFFSEKIWILLRAFSALRVLIELEGASPLCAIGPPERTRNSAGVISFDLSRALNGAASCATYGSSLVLQSALYSFYRWLLPVTTGLKSLGLTHFELSVLRSRPFISCLVSRGSSETFCLALICVATLWNSDFGVASGPLNVVLLIVRNAAPGIFPATLGGL